MLQQAVLAVLVLLMLPANAKNYIKTIEDMLHAEINFISVGAKRDEYLLKGEWL